MFDATFFKLYGAALIAFLAIDAIWLGIIARPFYAKHLSHVMTDQVQWWAAGLFYLLYIFGIVYFVLQQGDLSSATQVFMRGALLGVLMYATYDLTNQATIKDWSVIVTVVDIIWGGVLTGTVALIASRFA